VSSTFKGNAEVEYRAEGLSWELAAPLGDLVMELPSSGRGITLPRAD
jgi:hypothetical protein